MDTQELIKQYNAIAAAMPEAKLPALESGIYKLTEPKPETLNSADDVKQSLQAFNPLSGWLGYQSGNQYFKQAPLEIKDHYGVLMNAEMNNGNNESLHLRYNGNGAWILTQYKYKHIAFDSAQATDTDNYIVDRVEHLASNDELKKISYLRFWTIKNGNIGINPVFACFTGFGE